MKTMKTLTLAVFALLLTASLALADLGTSTGATNLSVGVVAEAALTGCNVTSPLISGNTLFNNYTGTTSCKYFVRTTQSGGTGSITLKLTSDFSNPGGPSILSAPSGASDSLTYSCSVPNGGGVGTPQVCGGASSVQISTVNSTAYNVASFGANYRTALAGDTFTLGWTLTNDPLYVTGPTTAPVLLTIAVP